MQAAALTQADLFTISHAADIGSGPIIAKGRLGGPGSNDIRALVSTLPESTRSALSTNLNALEQLVPSEVIRRAVAA